MPAKADTTASRTSAYHTCSRQRIDLRIDDVPLTPAGGNEILAELFADVRDVDLDQVGQRVLVLVEQVLVDVRPADQPPPVQGQQLGEAFFNQLNATSDWGAQFANKIAVKCP